MTADDRVAWLAAIKARVEAATPGPWLQSDRSIYDVLVRPVASTDRREDVEAHADGSFIAESRTDVPYLLALVERYEAALREIAKREGAWSRDQLTHANNTVDSMESIARAALAGQEVSGG